MIDIFTTFQRSLDYAPFRLSVRPMTKGTGFLLNNDTCLRKTLSKNQTTVFVIAYATRPQRGIETNGAHAKLNAPVVNSSNENELLCDR